MNLSRKKTIAWGAGVAAIAAAAAVAYMTYAGPNAFPNKDKGHAMLRLEDVGPGGDYGSLEGLGKLRAVLEYIHAEDIPYHVAVIPRRIGVEQDGSWTERGIDDPNPDDVVRGFVRLLQDAQRNGGVLGMHGYSHQYGAETRADGGHLSGTGNEFKVEGASVTNDPDYAAARIASSLAAFAGAGLQPAFWESPHYKDTREQEKVLRSYVGILYEPDFWSLRSLKDLVMHESVNTYGEESLGSVYVPAPFRYVGDAAAVDRMLEKARDDDGLASFYLHPFKEFDFLEPVLGPDGRQTSRDGLPEFRYGERGEASYLHRLADGFAAEGYRFMSLHDIVPYTPAHRVGLPTTTSAEDVLTGDVAGRGGDDVVVREPRRVLVVPGDYRWPRNRPQAAPAVWLKHAYAPEEQLLLADADGDGKRDLFAYDRRTGAVSVAISVGRRFREPTAYGRLPADLASLRPLRFGKEAGAVARANDRLTIVRPTPVGWTAEATDVALPADAELIVGRFAGGAEDDVLVVSPAEGTILLLEREADGRFAALRPVQGVRPTDVGRLLAGDADGDGDGELIAYDAKNGVWRVYERDGDARFRPIANDFGPWARGKERVGVAADFDGNGKSDIASYDHTERVLDLALSFRGGAR
ncbi:MAG TPA: DUF2334 domain-containing protein [Paenibacillus sp.]|nr:DUF2334 domain-containing protein [Paenibacillus sp.]